MKKLIHLPNPYPQKTGWLWNVDIPQFPATKSDGSLWPKISIITPSFNQAEFIEETIRSVIMQGYPNLEYIIIDGGSTDRSVEIIKKYEEYLTYWVSEPDRGQAHAINKGFQKTTGEIIAWINSDDTYLPKTLFRIADYFMNNRVNLLYGKAYYVDANNNQIGTYKSFQLSYKFRKYTYWRGWGIPQPSVFFSRKILDTYGFIDESLGFSIDYEWFLRISQYTKLIYINEFFSNYRLHESSKSGNWQRSKKYFYEECKLVNKKYINSRKISFWILELDRCLFFPIENSSILLIRKIKNKAIKMFTNLEK